MKRLLQAAVASMVLVLPFTCVLSCIAEPTKIEFVRQVSDVNRAVLYNRLLASSVVIECYSPSGEPSSFGSGWIVHDQLGRTFIWTAGHVVEDSIDKSGHFVGKIKVIHRVGEAENEVATEYVATVIKYSEWTDEDLCVLMIKAYKLGEPAQTLKNLNHYPLLGEQLILASTAGSTPTRGVFISEGILARKGVYHKFKSGTTGKYFDTYGGQGAAGCSGGQITNSKGYVVGMLTCGPPYNQHFYYIPMKRIYKWAEKENILFTLDPGVMVSGKFMLYAD